MAVADAKLGNSIQEKMEISCMYDSKIGELMRCIRSQISGLISGEWRAGLAASKDEKFCCYKLLSI